MAERKATRLSKAAREFNVGISTIVEFLGKKGHEIDSNPNSKMDAELYDLLLEEYSSDLNVKKESEKLTLKNLRERQESLSMDDEPEAVEQEDAEELLITDNTAGSSDEVHGQPVEATPVLEKEEKPEVAEPAAKTKAPADKPAEAIEKKEQPKPKKSDKTAEAVPEPEAEPEAAVAESGPKVIGKIDLDSMNQKTRPGKKSKDASPKEESPKAVSKKVKPTEDEAKSAPELAEVPEVKADTTEKQSVEAV